MKTNLVNVTVDLGVGKFSMYVFYDSNISLKNVPFPQ